MGVSDDSLHRDPGFYEVDGSATALVDQQRAETLDGLRSSEAVSVTYLDAEGGGTHWAIYLRDNEGDESAEGAQAFLVYALIRAWRDVLAASGQSNEWIYGVVSDAIEQGIAE